MRDAAWMWSETFLETANRLMARDRPADVEAPDWWEHFNRVARWSNEVEHARKEYLEGRPAQLQELYSFWLELGRFHLWR